MKYYFITWRTLFSEWWCNGLLKCVPFIYQLNRYTFIRDLNLTMNLRLCYYHDKNFEIKWVISILTTGINSRAPMTLTSQRLETRCCSTGPVCAWSNPRQPGHVFPSCGGGWVLEGQRSGEACATRARRLRSLARPWRRDFHTEWTGLFSFTGISVLCVTCTNIKLI